MARPYRLQIENGLYHLTSRGNQKAKIYLDEVDHKKFLEYIANAKERYKIYVYAYILMSNHYHLLIETTQENLSKMMHYVNGSYTSYFNCRHKKSGHLFQGRYKSILVDKEAYFMELTRYIHLNPVRAHIVDAPGEYEWSSYQEYTGRRKAWLIDKDRVKLYMDIDNKGYEQFVGEGMSNQKGDRLFDKVYAGFLLGKASFVKESLGMLKPQIAIQEVSYKNQVQRTAGVDEVVTKIAGYYGERPEDIYGARKKPKRSKKIAVYLSKRLTSMTNRELGVYFGIGHSAVSKAVLDIERRIASERTLQKEIKHLISHFEG